MTKLKQSSPIIINKPSNSKSNTCHKLDMPTAGLVTICLLTAYNVAKNNTEVIVYEYTKFNRCSLPWGYC